MTEPVHSDAPWRPPADLGDGSLAGAAIRLLRAAPRGLWMVLAVMVVVGLGLDLGARQLGVPLDGRTMPPETWAYLGVVALVNSVMVGVLLHLLLTGHTPRGLQAGLVAFVIWTAGTSLYANGLMTLTQGAQGAPPAELLPRFLVVAVGGVGGVIVFTRLLLLPIAWLVGDPGATPAAAWGRMRGQLVGYILASLVLSLPALLIGILLVGIAGGAEGAASPAARLAAQLMAAGLAALGAALNAVIYLRRVGAPQRLDEVFD